MTVAMYVNSTWRMQPKVCLNNTSVAWHGVSTIKAKPSGSTDFSVKKDFTPRVTHGTILHQHNLEYIMGQF